MNSGYVRYLMHRYFQGNTYQTRLTIKMECRLVKSFVPSLLGEGEEMRYKKA